MTSVHPWYSCLNACYDFFLTAAIPSPMSIIEWVLVVHASYRVRIHEENNNIGKHLYVLVTHKCHSPILYVY
jgi:hypothetical protein